MWAYLSGKKLRSGFGSSTTAEQVAQKNADHIKGRTYIVTGANSGIGVETTKQLFLAGGHVVMACRSVDKALTVAKSVCTLAGVAPVQTEEAGLPLFSSGKPGTGSVLLMELDLADLRSVRRFADRFKSLERPLHVLINNAGVMACPHGLTAQGFEMQFGTNHLAHFLLVELLRPELARQRDSRVIIVSSQAHGWAPPGGVPFDDLSGKQNYSRTGAYGTSKLCNVLHAQELNVQFRQNGWSTSAYSLHPGVIATGLQSHMGVFGSIWNVVSSPFGKTVPQGAATSLFCASEPNIDHEGAVEGWSYWVDCNMFEPSKLAQDTKLRKRLWQVSMDLIQDYLGENYIAADREDDLKEE